MVQTRSVGRILLVGLGLGVLANILLYNALPGIGVLLFVVGLLAALFGTGLLERAGLAWRNLWLIGPILFFAAMIFVRSNPTLTFLNITALIGLLVLLVFFVVAGRLERLGLLDYPLVLSLTTFEIVTRPGPALVATGQALKVGRKPMRLAVPVVRGALLAVPVLGVFTILLSSADTVFSKYVGDALQFKSLNMGDLVGRLIVIGLIAWLVVGGLLYGLSRSVGSESGIARLQLVRFNGKLGFVEVATVVALVDLLFLAFAWVQFTYLFNGEAARTMNYEAYRDYARRGFGELLAASVLTLLMINGLRWLGRYDTGSKLRLFNLLSTLMIALAMVMLVSAFQRMLAWESVEYYINTQIRLYVRWFIFWLGAAFIWQFLTLWVKPERFAIGALVAGLCFLITVNLANPDADVAAFNLARHDELSTRYLYQLSDDAVPTLAAGLNGTTGEIHNILQTDLSDRLSLMEYDRRWQDWPSFNLARQQAYDSLIALRRDGKIK